MVLPVIPRGIALQESLMTDKAIIARNGIVIVSKVKCRVTASRLLTDTPDPSDANTRIMAEWGWTLPLGTDVEVGDTIAKYDGSLSTIAGEVLKDDTWATAIRVWATRPKDAVALSHIDLYRFDNATETWEFVSAHDVHIHFDRNMPVETPPRYAPAGISLTKGGVVAGPLDFQPQTGDRFVHDGFPCVITSVMPGQPQRTEAAFSMDISGPRQS